jgi:hypothetical protein
MKKSIIAVAFAISFLGCASHGNAHLGKDFTISKFEAWSNKEKAVFINSLDKKSKMEFLSLLMRDRNFTMPPSNVVRFCSDGVFVFDGEMDDESKRDLMKFKMGRWYYRDGLIVIEHSDPGIFLFGKREVWDDMRVEKGEEEDGAMTIHVKEGVGVNGESLVGSENSLHGWWPDKPGLKLSPSLDAYIALRAQGKAPVPLPPTKRK